jgi:hypothetical protein
LTRSRELERAADYNGALLMARRAVEVVPDDPEAVELLDQLEKRRKTGHLVILVTGVRGSSSWAERLKQMIVESDPAIIAVPHKYGYFDSLRVFLPAARDDAVRRFLNELEALIAHYPEARRVDIVAHGFGAYLVAHALARLPAPTDGPVSPQIDTLILAGSPLRTDFPWEPLNRSGRVRRVINECGIDDLVVVLAQFSAVSFGMSGRLGFSGPHSDGVLNRYHEGGHSCIIQDSVAHSSKDLMERYWVPLLTSEAPPTKLDVRGDPRLHRGRADRILDDAGLVKYVPVLASLLVMAWALYGPVQQLLWPTADATIEHTPVTGDPLGEDVKKVVALGQDWSRVDRERFAFTSVGSQLVPYDWFLSLEVAWATSLFRANENLFRYRLIPQQKSALNPDGLPVGFAKDEGRTRAWLGLTCAACHTGQVHYRGVGYRVDGGPVLADWPGLMRDLTAALAATLKESPKFDRFAATVLAGRNTDEGRSVLRAELAILVRDLEGYTTRNIPAANPNEYGRLDLFGIVFNEVFHSLRRPQDRSSELSGVRLPDAPVSYPPLWQTPHLDRWFWTGSARNSGQGSIAVLERDVAQMLGFFVKVDVPEKPGIRGYNSSARVRSMNDLAELLGKLRSPKWPKDFPALDRSRVERGRLLYQKHCINCHPVVDSPQSDPGVVKLVDVGTDPLAAQRFAGRVGRAGKIEGLWENLVPLMPLTPKIGKTVQGSVALRNLVVGVILGSGFPALEDTLKGDPHDSIPPVPDASSERRPADTDGAPPGEVVPVIYKAQALHGIWATAPYLHNGSVPNLFELLLPPPMRSMRFTVGSREFDPQRVGFQTDKPGFFVFRVLDDRGNRIAGNSNQGHEFGTSLTEEEKLQLIEYLKSL